MRLLPILVTIFSLLLSCGTKKDQPYKKVDNFLDLKKGTTWTYVGELLGQKKELTVKVIEKSENSFKNSRGQIFTIDQYGIRDNNFYYIKYPLKKGSTWVNKVDNSIEIATIESITDKIEFGNDKVDNCIKVSYEKKVSMGHKVLVIRTFCPGIWLAKMETYSENVDQIAIPQSKFTIKYFEK